MSTLVEGNRESRDSLIFGDSANHWHQFGLDSSPFDDSLAVYYPVRQWEEHLSFLHQFRTASYPLLLIPGILGSGKTTLIKRFVESENDPIQIHFIEAQPHHALSQLIQMIYSANGVEAQNDANMPELLLQLSELSKKAGPQLLLIDNAHRLPRETLMRLLHLLFTQDLTQSQFRVVLSGESQIQETVMNLLDAFASSRQVPSLQLEPLSIQEVREYLEFRFEQAGVNQNLPFTPAVLKQIHLLSGGYPGRVNRVAQQVFVDNLKSDHQVPEPAKFSVKQLVQGHKIRLMGVGALFGLLLFVWQFQSRHSDSQTTIAENSSKKIAISGSANQSNNRKSTQHSATSTSQLSDDVKAALAAAVDKVDVSDIEAQQYEESLRMPVVRNQHLLAGAVMADSKVMLAEESTKKPQESLRVAANIPSEKTPEASTSEEDQPVAQPAAQPTYKTEFTLETRAPQQNANPVAASADTVTGAELQLMASKGYTIQIMGVREPQLLEAFIAENHLTDVSYYHTKMNRQDWYVLVYGNFQTQEEAKAALAKLPSSVKKQQPWVRSFDGVRQAIELAHQKEMPKESARIAVR